MTGAAGPMEVDVQGAGPPLVLVHSLLTDANAFEPVLPALTARHTVIRPSMPGFGATPPLDVDEPSVFDLADAVAAGLDGIDMGSNAAVLGNGLGAFVSLALAIRHGDRFGPLIVANCGAAFSEERRRAFTKMADLVEENGMEAVVDLAVHRIFNADHLKAHPELVDERRSVLVRTDPRAFAAACRALRQMDLRPDLDRIRNPMLIVAGGADQTTPPEMARDLAAAVDGADLVVLPGCGHCPPLEQPVAFVDEVMRFLDRLSTETPATTGGRR